MAQLSGPMAFPHATSQVTSVSSATQPKIPLGTRARDMAGNEYIYLCTSATHAKGEWVAWTTSFVTADIAATTGAAPVGVVCAEASSSDFGVWVQIYGYCDFALGSSSLTSGPVICAATTDGYSVVINATSGASQVMGVNLTTLPSTATSPGFASTASSILGVCKAMLNYPWATGYDSYTT